MSKRKDQSKAESENESKTENCTDSTDTPTETEQKAETEAKKSFVAKVKKVIGLSVTRAKGTAVVSKKGEILSCGIPGRSYYYARIISKHDGKMLLVTIDRNNVVKQVSQEKLEYDLHEICAAQLTNAFPFLANITGAQIKSMAATALLEMQLIPSEAVAPLKLKDEKGYAFEMMPWHLDAKEEPTPWFNRLLAQVETNREALEIWLGSLFDPASDKSQYIYLMGDGNDGKGRLIAFLLSVMRSAGATCLPPRPDDKFFFSTVFDKRIAIFSDIDDYKVCSSHQIKALTGDSVVPVERKGKDSFMSSVNCKVLFASNKEAGINAGTADQRRIILCQMQSVVKNLADGTKDYSGVATTKDMDQGLLAEGHVFLSKCYRKYKAACPNGEKINSDQSAAMELADSNDAEFLNVIESHCIVDPELFLTFRGFQFLMEREGLQGPKVQGFRNWLKLRYRIKHCLAKLKREETPIRALWGIGLNPAWHSSEYGSSGQRASSKLSELEYAGHMKKLGLKKSGGASGTKSGEQEMRF